MQNLSKWFISIMMIVCFSASGYELQPYQNPVPLGGYIKDVVSLFKKTTQRAKWQLVDSDSGEYLAKLQYKKYKLEVEFVVANEAVTVQLKSVYCNECKVDQTTVDKLMIRLRRTLAYEVTVEARDSFFNF